MGASGLVQLQSVMESVPKKCHLLDGVTGGMELHAWQEARLIVVVNNGVSSGYTWISISNKSYFHLYDTREVNTYS